MIGFALNLQISLRWKRLSFISRNVRLIKTRAISNINWLCNVQQSGLLKDQIYQEQIDEHHILIISSVMLLVLLSLIIWLWLSYFRDQGLKFGGQNNELNKINKTQIQIYVPLISHPFNWIGCVQCWKSQDESASIRSNLVIGILTLNQLNRKTIWRRSSVFDLIFLSLSFYFLFGRMKRE